MHTTKGISVCVCMTHMLIVFQKNVCGSHVKNKKTQARAMGPEAQAEGPRKAGKG
jgi:hypothetical protein